MVPSDAYEPIKVMTGVQLISAGANHSGFIDDEGSLMVCGKNDFGQLGINTFVDQR
jgi:alpha-tubulin suppressor-like RCC1 family protein